MAEAINAINQFTSNMDAAAFRTNPKTIAAVERKLSVISEGAIRLGDQAEVLCPGLAWRNIRGIGNWRRHQYDRIDVEAVWQTVIDDLPPWQSTGHTRCRPPHESARLRFYL
jgi:uncharacterized protein with HEPN domain